MALCQHARLLPQQAEVLPCFAAAYAQIPALPRSQSINCDATAPGHAAPR